MIPQKQIDILRTGLHFVVAFGFFYWFCNRNIVSGEIESLTSLIILSGLLGLISGVLWEYFNQWQFKSPVSRTDIILTVSGAILGGVLSKYLPNNLWLQIIALGVSIITVTVEAIRIYKLKNK